MKIFPKKEKNAFSIIIENIEDLSFLEKLIEKGDIIGKVDYRTTSKGERGTKIKGYIKIKAEKISFEIEKKAVKVLGEIIEAPADMIRGYHSFSLVAGEKIDIYKNQISTVFKALIEKIKKSKPFKVLGVVVDNREATFGEITHGHVIELFTLRNKAVKGQEESTSYYKEIAKNIENLAVKYDGVILAGPGFVKEDIKKLLSLSTHSILIGDTSVTGIVGLKEIIKRGLLFKFANEISLQEEISIIEKAFIEMKKESGLIAIGAKEVKESLQYGSAEKIVVAYDQLEKKEIREIINKCQEMACEVIIIEKVNPYYHQIMSMGGIIALLRFPIHI